MISYDPSISTYRCVLLDYQLKNGMNATLFDVALLHAAAVSGG